MPLIYLFRIQILVVLFFICIAATPGYADAGRSMADPVSDLLDTNPKRQIRQLQKEVVKLEKELFKLEAKEELLARDEELLKKEAWAEAGKRKKRRNPDKIKRREQKILDKLTAKRQELKIQRNEIASVQGQIRDLQQQIAVLSNGEIVAPVIKSPEQSPMPLTKLDRSLEQEIEKWLGTPYRYGGTSGTGVDCSGLVGNIYRTVYNKNLPRTSADMYRQSKKVGRSGLQKGDLVFFKIRNSRVNHVGIYLGNDQFVHASSSRGVMISSLDEAYFQRYFVGGGRI